MEKLKGLSAFFPAYNEEANVERMVNGFRSVLPQIAGACPGRNSPHYRLDLLQFER